jgi:hypothetical protein
LRRNNKPGVRTRPALRSLCLKFDQDKQVDNLVSLVGLRLILDSFQSFIAAENENYIENARRYGTSRQRRAQWLSKIAELHIQVPGVFADCLFNACR